MEQLQEYLNLLEELKKRQEHASITYSPLEKQKEFHSSNAWCRIITGGNRSGKSRAAAQEYHWWFTNTHPYIKTPEVPRIWILSAEYRTLYEGIWLHLKNTIPAWEIARIGPKVQSYDMPNFIESKSGSRIDFISGQAGEDTRRKLQSAEIDLIGIDEEVDGSFWDELQARLVTRGGKACISATLIEGKDWITELIDQAEQGDKEVFHVCLDTRENPHNNQAAVKRFISRLSDEERQVRVEGKVRKQSGLIYAFWKPELHEIDPFPIPSNWTKMMIFDPGFRVAAGLYIAIAPDNKKYGYREIYLNNCTLFEFVNELFISEGWEFKDGIFHPTPKAEVVNYRLIDPAAFKHHSDGSIGVGYTLANEYGLSFYPANNDKRKNIEDVRRALMCDLDGTPNFRIFNNLQYFKMERKNYRIKPRKSHSRYDEPADRPIKRSDHLMNCIEYGLSANVDFIPEQTQQEYIHDLAQVPDDEIDWPESNKRLRLLINKQRKRMQNGCDEF